MAVGSVLGSTAGGLLVGAVPEAILIPNLFAILVVSAAKVWTHKASDRTAHTPG